MKIVIDIDDADYHRIINGFANEDDAILLESTFKCGVLCADKQPMWIPVNEKLPNFNDIVLASVIDDIGLRVIIIKYRGEEFWFNGRITAWMPLPEPYKESEDK